MEDLINIVSRLNSTIMDLELEISMKTKDEVRKHALNAIEGLKDVVKVCDNCKPCINPYQDACCDKFLEELMEGK